MNGSKRNALVVAMVAIVGLFLGETSTVKAASLHDGLLSYWTLGEGSGTSAADTAPGGSVADTGTLRNSPTWINGKFNAGLQFDGATQDVLIPSSADMDIGSNAVTVSAWVKLDQLPSTIAGSFAGILDSQPDNFALYQDKGNNELRFKVTDANGTSTSAHPGVSASMLDTTDWHHVMGVYDGSVGSVKIYYDGVLADVASISTTVGTVRTGQVSSLGAQPTTALPNTASNFFEGGVSDVAVWNRPLNAAEAQYLYNSGTGNAVGAANPMVAPLAPLAPSAPSAQPVIHYAFDGNLDNSGTGGAALNGVFHDGPGMTGPQYAATDLGQGLDLSSNSPSTNSVDGDGNDTGKYVSVDYTLAEQGTIELRFSSDNSFNFQTLWGNSVHGNAWESWVYGNERLAARANNASNASNLDYLLTLVGGIEDVHHIAFTWERDGTVMESRLYVDGELREIAGENWLDPGTTFYLGGGPGNHLGQGIYDELKIYDVALSAGEVLHNSLIPEPGSFALAGLASLIAGAWGIRRRALLN